METIEIKNLSFKYPTRKAPALNDINIKISEGEFVTICGKSGCGKSTLLRQLKPTLAPFGEKNGVICFNGQDILTLSHKEQAEKIGFVMQNPDNQLVCDKVWHELAFGLENLSYQAAEIRTRVAEMASFFGIQNWYYKDVNELSGGQKQLLNLAAVMVMQPSVLILDEPTSQLDPIAAHDFLDTLSKINKELGTTIILSEHRLEEALPISDRVIVMDSGKIIADGSPDLTGSELKAQKSDMMLALPTPMRVYYSLKNDQNCPLNVREGKKWLLTMPLNKDIEFNKNNTSKSQKPLLKISDLWFKYEKNAPDVLKGLSTQIYENEFYSIVGGNGTGKSTLLSLITGINTAYRGKIEVLKNKKIAVLPQNPQNLFVEKTVLLDLWEMLKTSTESQAVKEQKIKNVISFCELDNLLNSHPYDLSGGEQQRAALAKVLLLNPDILLLDEPTKGLDAHFKKKLATLLKGLQKSGVTIVMVSHDIEFCAKYSDRAAMFFDGQIVSENEPRAFFSGKSFYTTAANKMARDIRKDVVTSEDIIAMLGGKQEDYDDFDLPKDEFKNTYIAPPKKNAEFKAAKHKANKKSIFGALIILMLIPLTIFFGFKYFGDRRYYFTSILIILESMLPFALIFEGRKPEARELVIISVMCAIAVCGRIAFAALPQFKPVLALVIISGLCFGGETGFLVGALTAFVSNFYFTQGPWTPYQMFAFGIIGFLSGVLFYKSPVKKSKTVICIFGFLAALIIYGLIMNISDVLLTQEKITLSIITAHIAKGFYLDLIHALSTAFFLWLALKPMCEKLERVKIKYGLIKEVI